MKLTAEQLDKAAQAIKEAHHEYHPTMDDYKEMATAALSAVEVGIESHMVRDGQTLCGLSNWEMGNVDLPFGAEHVTTCVSCLRKFISELTAIAGQSKVSTDLVERGKNAAENAWFESVRISSKGCGDWGKVAEAVIRVVLVDPRVAGDPTEAEWKAYAAHSPASDPAHARICATIFAPRRERLLRLKTDLAVDVVREKLKWYGSCYAEEVDAEKIVALVRESDAKERDRIR